ncbi:HEAT repeat domain-containing protein [Desulfosarcina sp. OttesenSCG-928-A07]|nr:HEAT repeat domain-containing protein [Desulfosarcina sp. OttesenSCG-928-G17]MDL2330372.1 HEAT repeat domain-containing protein [Desulfosarcina sp. OttesenSCG-928-A07]
MGVIPDNQKPRIEEWAKTVSHPIPLRYAVTGHPADDSIKAFVTELSEIAECIQPKQDSDTEAARPSLFIGDQVTYQAIPLDRELDLFLSALSNPSAFAAQIEPEVKEQLDLLRIPAMVKVYITSHCPFCPATVTLLLGLAGYSEQVRLTVIDGTLFPEAAEEDRVQSAPTLILDDAFRWTGSVNPMELVTLMLDRNPADLGPDALRAMIENGDADGVARLMAGHNQIFPAFLALLAHPRWSVRLGAMVVFEILGEDNPDLAKKIVPLIVDIFPGADPSVRGDLLHVLGESKNPAALSFLEEVMQTETDSEVREAANEAMEKLM